MEGLFERQSPAMQGWTVNGSWWTADDPATAIGGVLTFDPRYGAVLNLAGGLADRPGTPMHHLICGDAEGRRYTLLDARWQRSTAHGAGPEARTTTERWTSDEVLVGAHVLSGQEARWQTLEVETRCLPSWAASGDSIQSSFGDGGESIFHVTTPKSLRVDIAGIADLEFWWRYSEEYDFLTTKVAVTPTIRVGFASPMTLTDARAEVITPLLQLITLLTGHTDSVSSMQAMNDEGAVVVYKADRRSPLGVLEVHPTSQLASLEEIADDLDVAVERWFETHRRARSALVDLFAPPWNGTTAEMEFQRVCRSAEAFHRFVFGGTYMDDDEFKRLVTTVRQSLDGPERQFVDMRLRYGNELTLKQRIDALVAMCAAPLREHIGEYESFSRGVVDTRNALTHDGALNEKTFSVSEVYWATETLRLVMTVVLLVEIGRDADSALESALRSNWARQVFSTSNSLRYWRQIRGIG